MRPAEPQRTELPVWLRGISIDVPLHRRALILACETCVREPDKAQASMMRLMLKAPDLDAAEELWYAALSMLYVSNFAAELVAEVARAAGVICSARRIRVEWPGGGFDIQEHKQQDVWPMRFVAKLVLELFTAPNHDAALEILNTAFVLVESDHG